MKSTIFNFKNLLGCLCCVFLFPFQTTFARDPRLTVDASQVLRRITPIMYGSCIEDVNHEIYGGLYDQKIFGESFEEPSPGMNFVNFTKFEGSWNLVQSIVSVQSWPGAKLVSNIPGFTDGSAEVNLKFTGASGDNAGLIFHVANSGNGADTFDGYEISLMQSGTLLRLGRHQHNYAMLKEVNVSFTPGDWTNLRVEMTAGRIRVYINKSATPAMDYTDNAPLLTGSVGLRTWNSDVQFKDLIINTPVETITPVFKPVGTSFVSGMWDVISNAADSVDFAIDDTNPYNGSMSQSIDYVRGTNKAGVVNKGLNRWGIAVTKDQLFQGRLYLRAAGFTGPVTVALQSADGTITYASQTISGLTGTWAKYPFSLTSSTTDPKARFAVWIQDPGKVWIDQVVLMQTGDQQFKGLPYRADIGNAMVAEGLSFLRYGGTMVNAPGYLFKKMIGDADLRPPYQGNWYKYSSNGFGIEDFLKFTEAAGITSAFAINIEETAQDAADMVEYLNGDASTVWGAKRVANGHADSYHVKYIEIGNEEVIGSDDATQYLHYCDRFEALYAAMHAKDPSIQFINSAWWRPGSANMKVIFDRLNGKAAYWDYHCWADDTFAGTNVDKDLTNMKNYFLGWDPTTTMKCTIFEENGNLHNMQRALGHATTLNAVLRHSDFVLTSCQANALQPYLQNDNGWDQGQIFFTPSRVWNMPPYYAQQMASATHLPLLVSSGTVAGLDITATRSESGDTLMINVVNINGTPVKTVLTILGFSGASGDVKTYTLSGALNAENTLADPQKYATVESSLHGNVDSISYSFPAYSYTILRYLPVVSETTKITAGNTMTIKPNPANDQINIVCKGSGDIYIYDVNGKVVLTKKIANSSNVDLSGASNDMYAEQVDISKLQKGMYFVKKQTGHVGEAISFIKR